MTSTDEATLLTVVEVSRRLRVSISTVYKAIDRGELPALKVGPRAIRVDELDLADYLERMNDDEAAT